MNENLLRHLGDMDLYLYFYLIYSETCRKQNLLGTSFCARNRQVFYTS